MQNKARLYGEILYGVFEKTPENKQEKLTHMFIQFLKKKGALKLLSKILQEFATLWKERNGKIGLMVFAKPPAAKLREYAKKAIKAKGFVYEEKIDGSLVGGSALFLGNEYCIDNSVKEKIRNLHTHLVERITS